MNKCSCAPILNFSPKSTIGGSRKGGILDGVFLAIFATIFCDDFLRFLAHFVASTAKSRQFLSGLCTVVQRQLSAGISLPFIGDAFVF